MDGAILLPVFAMAVSLLLRVCNLSEVPVEAHEIGRRCKLEDEEGRYFHPQVSFTDRSLGLSYFSIALAGAGDCTLSSSSLVRTS